MPFFVASIIFVLVSIFVASFIDKLKLKINLGRTSKHKINTRCLNVYTFNNNCFIIVVVAIVTVIIFDVAIVG